MAAPMEKMASVSAPSTSDSTGDKQTNPLPYGNRKFYMLPRQRGVKNKLKENGRSAEQSTELLSYIHSNVIGHSSVFYGPFGQRKVVYCDYTASGRSLEMIEDYIRRNVLPLYGNTHTTTTVTSLQTTLYRHEARDIIRNAVHASEHDAVIFVGTGCTAAVHKLIHSLNLQSSPVVFVGPFEHHSNLLPWREIGAEVIRIAENPTGLVDADCLENELKKWQPSGRQLIGCFSAASNVTGILTDDIGITVILHRYGALAFWDYATAGPYVDINMNPLHESGNQQYIASKDAIFLSPHKFVGGVETPGILVAKKTLFRNSVPSGSGGGSVFFVSPSDHRYLKQVEMREEGGTPSIVGAVRAGLTFQLKESVGADYIMTREHELCRRAISRWSKSTNLVLLGNTEVPRLPIFSFLIKHPATGQYLHHNFVCAVLNDVFGIQSRGGCACAGPYAQDLLGIDEQLAKEIEAVLLEDSRLDRVHLRRYTEYSEKEILRPGFTRLNLPYFMDDDCVDFILDAVSLTAQHAWKLLPQYIFNPETGEWKQKNHQVFQDRRWLGSISYVDGKMTYPEPSSPNNKGRLPTDYKDCLELALKIFEKSEKVRVQLPDQTLLFDSKVADLRWFMLPSEALGCLGNKTQLSHHAVRKKMPFEAVRYPQMAGSSSKLVGKQHQDVEITSDQQDKEEGSIGIAPEDVSNTSSVSESMSQDVSRQNWQEESKSDNFDHSMSCSERFQKTTERGFVEAVGEAAEMIESECTDPPKGSNNMADQIKGQSDTEDDRASFSCPSPVDTCLVTACNKLPGTNISNTDIERRESESFEPSSELIVEHTSKDCLVGTLKSNDSTNHDGGVTRVEDVVPTSSCFPLVLHEAEINPKGFDSNCDTSEGTAAVIESSQLLETEQRVKPIQEAAVSGSNSTLTSGPASNGDAQSSSHSQRSVSNSLGKKKRSVEGFQKPPKSIFKPTVQALEEYKMIEDGDRVLVCLSGGKDSLSLLHTLKQYQFYAKSKGINFDLGGVTVDPQTLAYDPRPLIPYLASLGVQYFYEEQCIIDTAASLEGGCDSICSFCSRMKRGRLYACARREGYNVLAMGQHLDDLSESFLMSVFHNGLLRTMKANYTVKEGDLRVIRPFVYTREKDLRNFAEKSNLPVIPENCPACFEAPKERHRTKQLLASQELLFPRLYSSLQAAMKPLMAKNKTGMESSRKKEDFFEESDL